MQHSTSALLSLALSLGLTMAMPLARADDKAANPQQNRMAQCNKDAKDMKGDERKQFMSHCLSGKPSATPAQPAQPATQQDRMRHCNAEAKDKKGDERKQFMSQCLKSK